jgi:hypothetical protein
MDSLLTRNSLRLAAKAAGISPSATTTRTKRSVVYPPKFWPNATTLLIAFIDELEQQHKEKIVEAINQWQPYVNLRFEFVDGREGHPGYLKGDIRILTNFSQNYSVFGTDAKQNDPWDATMVLGIKPSDPKFVSTVLHEFGHALGAEHEHQHPEADIPWDLPKVYEYYTAKGHSKDVIDESVLRRVSADAVLMLPYDRHSIMHYPVDNALTIGDWAVGDNLTLSDKDKEFMRRAYPRE